MKNIDDMTDMELEDVYLHGENLQPYDTRAARAKRLLEIRQERHREELASRAYSMQVAMLDEQAHASEVQIEAAEKQKEIAERIIGYLDYFKNNWFVRRTWWQQLGLFLLASGIFAFLVNLAASWVAKFILHW
jgi:hypothetical protein